MTQQNLDFEELKELKEQFSLLDKKLEKQRKDIAVKSITCGYAFVYTNIQIRCCITVADVRIHDCSPFLLFVHIMKHYY